MIGMNIACYGRFKDGDLSHDTTCPARRRGGFGLNHGPCFQQAPIRDSARLGPLPEASILVSRSAKTIA